MESISPEVSVFVFFATTSIAIASLHIGLIRLALNLDSPAVGPKERGGVLIVMQFAIVAAVCASLPLATQTFLPDIEKHSFASWFTPAAIFALAVLDLWRTNSENRDCYYNIAVSLVLIASGSLLVCKHVGVASLTVFILSLTVALVVMVAQLFKSTLRIGKIIT